MSIRVALVDDHPVVRDGLRYAIQPSDPDVIVVAEAAHGMEILRKARTTRIDVFIIDIIMPVMNGIQTTRELLRRFPDARVIILSLHDTRTMVEAALAAGARGYLTKDVASRCVVDAIKDVHHGRYSLSPSVAHYAVQTGPSTKRVSKIAGARHPLTRQEEKVLQLIAEGHSNKEIAALLARSVHTIHAQRNSVMTKLKIHKQSELIRYAIKAGIAKL